MIYHLMLKTELVDFHLLDGEQHIPLGSHCKSRTTYVIRIAKKRFMQSFEKKSLILNLSASAPKFVLVVSSINVP
jgi:hypothetical protein